MGIRLLFLIPEIYPTFRADVNVLFGKVLPQHGIQSDIVAGKILEKAEACVWGGGETYLSDVSSGATQKHIKTFLHCIKHLFKANILRYHAIQVRDMPILAAIGLIVTRLRGLKFIYWMSYPMPEGHILLARERGLSAGLMKFIFPWARGRIGYFLLYHFILQNVDHVFVQSEQMKIDLIKRGVHPDKMTPVPMGVDVEILNNFDVPLKDDRLLFGKRVLVYLGSLDRPRRIEILFEMLAIVKNKFPNVLLVVVGDTRDKVHYRWLKMKVEEAGINDHLLWTGWLSQWEGWCYVRAAEIGLSPIPRGYLLDCSSPTKVAEYLALGVPVICNDNPDQEQVIRDSGAGICVPYDAKSFASAVIRMLCLDKTIRSDMGKKGKKYVCHYRDYRVIGHNVANSYRNMFN